MKPEWNKEVALSRTSKFKIFYYTKGTAEISLWRALWGGWKGLGGGARANAKWCLWLFLTYRRRKQEQNFEKPWGKLLLPVPHLPLTHPTGQKAEPWGLWLLLSLPTSGVLCSSALGVSRFDERHPHTPIVQHPKCPFIPLPGMDIPGGATLSFRGFPCPLFLSQAGKDKNNPKALKLRVGVGQEKSDLIAHGVDSAWGVMSPNPHWLVTPKILLISTAVHAGLGWLLQGAAGEAGMGWGPTGPCPAAMGWGLLVPTHVKPCSVSTDPSLIPERISFKLHSWMVSELTARMGTGTYKKTWKTLSFQLNILNIFSPEKRNISFHFSQKHCIFWWGKPCICGKGTCHERHSLTKFPFSVETTILIAIFGLH